MKSGESRANANRRVRQDALREQLSNQGHVQQAVEIIEKLKDLDETKQPLDALQVTRLSKALEGHMKLINKYLPDQKEVFSEHTGEDGGPVKLQEIVFNPVGNGSD
jgi:hypothetical protein